MIESRSKVINGSAYTVTQLPARRALRLKTRLVKMFGASFSAFISAMSDPNSTITMSQIIELLTPRLDESEFESLMMQMLIGVRKEGMELNEGLIDVEFAGDLDSMFKVVWFVVEVNFANFFSMIGIGKLFQENASLSDTNPISPMSSATSWRSGG